MVRRPTQLTNEVQIGFLAVRIAFVIGILLWAGLLPLTAVNDALRANMLEGASIASLSPELAVIVIWGVLSFFAALKLFRWR